MLRTLSSCLRSSLFVGTHRCWGVVRWGAVLGKGICGGFGVWGGGRVKGYMRRIRRGRGWEGICGGFGDGGDEPGACIGGDIGERTESLFGLGYLAKYSSGLWRLYGKFRIRAAAARVVSLDLYKYQYENEASHSFWKTRS